MKTVGLFEAKTKFSEICKKVESGQETFLITNRGKAVAKLVPVTPQPEEAASEGSGFKSSVWRLREEYIKKFGPLTEDFELEPRKPWPQREYFTDEDL
jgi:prevent-host-death family protein